MNKLGMGYDDALAAAKETMLQTGVVSSELENNRQQNKRDNEMLEARHQQRMACIETEFGLEEHSGAMRDAFANGSPIKDVATAGATKLSDIATNLFAEDGGDEPKKEVAATMLAAPEGPCGLTAGDIDRKLFLDACKCPSGEPWTKFRTTIRKDSGFSSVQNWKCAGCSSDTVNTCKFRIVCTEEAEKVENRRNGNILWQIQFVNNPTTFTHKGGAPLTLKREVFNATSTSKSGNSTAPLKSVDVPAGTTDSA
ncbi:MAG: hypothetical protein SGILL_005763 [Bacillariaceae sp.]